MAVDWHHNASDSLSGSSFPALEYDSYSYLHSEYLHDVEVPNDDEADLDAAITGILRPRLGCGRHHTAPSVMGHFEEIANMFASPYLVGGGAAAARSPFVVRSSFAPPPPHPPHDPEHAPHFPAKPVFAYNITLPSALTNHTLHVHVAQFKSILPKGGFVTKVFVNGVWVSIPDVPARNGAIHVVKRLIRPFRKGHHPGHKLNEVEENEAWYQTAMMNENERDNEWDDWEEWLPQWANED